MPTKPSTTSAVTEKIISRNVFQSDFYLLKHWEYDFMDLQKAEKGFNDCLCIVYVKQGSFQFDLATQSYDMHSGYIVIDKPNYEYQLRPAAGKCTIFNFTDEFYTQFVKDMLLEKEWFFANRNVLSLLLQSPPSIDYFHHRIMQEYPAGNKLEMDMLVLEFFNQIVNIITGQPGAELKKCLLPTVRLSTIEAAKEYIQVNFSMNISLYEIAAHCFISPFHFSRVFKLHTSYSPNQYLQNTRLTHGEMLLKNSRMPITDVCYASGFSSVEYFATAFKKKYRVSPTVFRHRHQL